MGFERMDFVIAFPQNKNWFYNMSQKNRCWTDEVNIEFTQSFNVNQLHLYINNWVSALL